MKCDSCKTEIDPKCKFAIEQNSCPFCGQTIMDAQLKDLFTALYKVMSELIAEHSEQLEDWMLANFDYTKRKSPIKEKTTTVVKNKDGKDELIEVEKLMSEKQTSNFFQKAFDVKDPDTVTNKINHLKELAKKIKNNEIQPENVPITDDDSDDDLKSQDDDDDNDDDKIPVIIQSMANNASSGDEDSQIVQKLEKKNINKIKSARNALRKGTGSFSRS